MELLSKYEIEIHNLQLNILNITRKEQTDRQGDHQFSLLCKKGE